MKAISGLEKLEILAGLEKLEILVHIVFACMQALQQ